MNLNETNIIMLSSVDWDYLQQRSHVFARGLANYGARVIFIENTGVGRRLKMRGKDILIIKKRIKKIFTKKNNGDINHVPKNLKIITPFVLPPAGSLENLLNYHFFIPSLIKKIKKERLNDKLILITSLPTITSVAIIKKLNPTLVVYDCASNLEDDVNIPKSFKKIESKLLELTDVVLTDSSFLYNKFTTLHPHVFRIHHGVDVELFNSISDIKGERKLTCYFGTIGPWIDLNVIKTLVSNGYNVKIIGKNLLPSTLTLPEGVSVEGPYSQKTLVQKIKDCGSIILPYITKTSHMKGVIPAKIYECLQTGRPVLSSFLENYDTEIKEHLYICNSPQEFYDTLNNLDKIDNNIKKKLRLEYAKKHSHESKLGKLMEVIELFLKYKDRTFASLYQDTA